MEIILFFLLGITAALFKSDLEIPESVSKFFSIFLLLSIGLKGGHELTTAENFSGFLPVLITGIASCILIPIIIFRAFKMRLGIDNAAALSACYGSVSAITFITAQTVLQKQNIVSSGYMVAVMALMEIPAILGGVYFYKKSLGKYQIQKNSGSFKSILSSKSIILLIGGFLIGLVMDSTSWAGISPLIQGCFKGILAFFLIDLGLAAQRQLKEAFMHKSSVFLIAVLLPLMVGTVASMVSCYFNVALGDRVLISVLVGSASYIAAPAAIRASMPQANPSLYLGLPLAITFPLNLAFGIPYYIFLSQALN